MSQRTFRRAYGLVGQCTRQILRLERRGRATGRLERASLNSARLRVVNIFPIDRPGSMVCLRPHDDSQLTFLSLFRPRPPGVVLDNSGKSESETARARARGTREP